MTVPELSRPVRIDTLGPAPRSISIEADEAERAALAKRFAFVAISSLSADVALEREGETVKARGTVRARLAQSCVATGETVEERIEESFEVEFRPQPKTDGPEEEVELGANELDVIFYDGASVDIGEAAAQTLPLAVEPYPRSPGAGEALKSAGVKSEEEAGPFAALAALKDKLKP